MFDLILYYPRALFCAIFSGFLLILIKDYFITRKNVQKNINNFIRITQKEDIAKGYDQMTIVDATMLN